MATIHPIRPPSTPGETIARVIADAITALAPQAPPDELLSFPFGLEPRAARALVRNGTLTAAKIGRRTYARRSDVLALVDKLAKKPAKTEPIAGYADLVANARGRK